MYLAIDLGGTKTLIATFSSEGQLLESVRFPTPEDYEEFLGELSKNVSTLEINQIDSCVMAVPGLIDREQGIEISLGNLPWKNKHIRDDVSKTLGNIPVSIENDSKTGGISEALLLQGKYEDVLYLTVSTGIGAALVRNGEIVKPVEDMELGKIPILFEGKITQWEEFAGGRAIVKRFGKRASEITDPEVWNTIGDNLAYGLGIGCSVLQPDAIVFGGGAGQFAGKFKTIIIDYLKSHLHPNVRQPQAILTAQRPNEAVIYGCYELAKRMHGQTHTSS